MILLIDNYDSFSYNLYQLVGSIEPDIQVVRNDAITVEEILEKKPELLILSPGPGRPEQAGVCIEAVKRLGGVIPILGVCLGHQAICRAYGGAVTYAKQLMHGKTSRIYTDPGARLFQGMDTELTVGRYHSLAAEAGTIPAHLKVTAHTMDGEVMAVQHTVHPIYGVQFHPESILTPDGKTMLRNFIEGM